MAVHGALWAFFNDVGSKNRANPASIRPADVGNQVRSYLIDQTFFCVASGPICTGVVRSADCFCA